ncbi:ATP-binding protein [Undibacterium sp.]|jgi:two-component system NarL family sensor kinase|uniref:sensor histidine kinase n=1 Tax=Undibacterium sp. TaxID=1914977 RepID=UPI002CBCC264|nr:ATP-binding protein [Undibacterium sp.]HTD02959.1 ATP-binding protein [Undibacterium sp.]
MLKLQQVLGVMRKMRSEIELSEPQFGELTDLFGISSLVIDNEGAISSINDTAADMLGFKVQELLGTLLMRLVVDGDRALDHLLHQGPKSSSYEPFDLVLHGRSGRKSAVFVVPVPIDQVDGVACSIMLMLTEKAKRQASSHTLQHSELELQQFANRLIVAHEVELKRVSSELHDGIGQVLAMIKFMVEDASRRLKQGKVQEGAHILDETVQRLRDAMDDVRRLSSELRPSTLDDLGLLPTVEGHCRKYEDAYDNIKLERHLNVEEAEIPAHLKSEIFRIIQEAMNNAAKHACASTVAVSMLSDHGNLILGVQDNGVGFDTKQFTGGHVSQQGIGLRSMRERAESTGGFFAIKSSPGSGTTVEVRWKLHSVVMRGTANGMQSN